MASHSEELDAEGIPDLDDSLPEKEITGDAQEGLIPPSDHKLAPDDIYARDTLDQRLREEVPDRISEQDEEAPRLMDSSSDDFEDRSAAETETGDEGGALSAEESAIHVTDEPPGVVDDDRDSYTGEPIP
jgi:hypothetical protein